MNRKSISYIVFFAFLVMLVASDSPATAESTGKLIIDISGFPSSEGFAMVALHNSQDSYTSEGDTAIAKTRIKVVNQEAQVVFVNVAYGWYGVSIFHDENANMKMDKNAMGIPKESYGFSNNAKGFFGKPKYKDVMFQMNSAEKQIAVNLD
ncbi:MAG: DUF2141 domain-containing protein [Desulfobacterales bacterium]|nr:DUF2141 domain-containing protein [Desulfobacterales bacterium]